LTFNCINNNRVEISLEENTRASYEYLRNPKVILRKNRVVDELKKFNHDMFNEFVRAGIFKMREH
jgi:hypothetical protein